MFADGFQDWLGLSENRIGKRYVREGLRGHCQVAAIMRCDDGASAARITGEIWKRKRQVPNTMIIVDSMGVIHGIGRSLGMYSENRFLNRVFYLSKLTGTKFFGYIRNYDSRIQYTVRSADDGTLSEETVSVQVPIAESTNG